jgi:cysteinyl-tRNA synthetase
MQEIVDMVQALVAKGVAYQIDSDVYFAIKGFPRYGALSRRKLDEMQAGARVEVDERKRHPMDFALWKSAKPGEPAWDSPWGSGRPGWHIECSAMSVRHLGETFDIHGGGEDLIFPHHENEIAQSETATGKEFARYWVHNGLVTVDQEKMSKSLGNFFTIREIFEKFPASAQVTAEVLRFFLLSTHYRSPVDFSDAALRRAWAGLDNFYDLFVRLKEPSVHGSGIDEDENVRRELQRFAEDFERGMDDDFNTPVVIANFQSLRNDLNRRLQGGLPPKLRADALEVFRHFGQVLGLFQVSPIEWEFSKVHWESTQAGADVPEPPVRDLDIEEIEQLLEDRNEARRRKDYAKADEIRLMLSARGIIIEDRSDGSTRWKR